MNKKIKYILIIILIIFIIFFLHRIFKTHHKISYNLNKKTSITEEYIKNKDNNYYLLSIKIKNKEFLYDIDNKFHKKKRIVKQVKTYEKDNTLCIYPMLIDNSILDIECNIDNKLYSYASVKDKVDLKKLTKSIKNYSEKNYKNDTKTTKKYNDITIYNNLEKEENILVYNYKELIKIKSNSDEVIKFSDFDIYNNNMGILINNLYVVPKYSKKPEISSYYIIDIIKNKKHEIKLKNKLSTSIYINGVVDDKLYIFDKSNIIQYVIDPKTKKIKKSGDKTSIKYYDGKWIDYNPYEYVKKELKFNYIEENKMPFEYKQIYQTSKYYYYYDKYNNFYKVYKNNLKSPIFLFNQSDIKEISIINDKIYFLIEDTLYRYDEYGIKNILKRKEINYNSKNIYSVYFE